MKIKLWIASNNRHEEIIDYPDLDDMTKEEREKELDEIASDYANNYIEFGAEIVEEES
jgi:uncharacterized cupin superfamily protein